MRDDSKLGAPFSKLAKEAKLREAKKRLRYAVSADSEFQRLAEQDFRFHAGHQWKPEEKRVLEVIEKRPALTFNLIKPAVDLVLGVVENNQVAITPEPTEKNDQFLADILADADNKLVNLGSLSDKEDDAFENACICGRGFVAIDIAPDPERLGEIIINEVSIPPHEIKLDPAGTQDDLSDHRYIFWDKWLTFEDFKIQYPKHAKRLDEIVSADPGEEMLYAKAASTDVWDLLDEDSDDSDYDMPLDFAYYDKSRGRVHVCHMEYWEVYDRYYGFNPMTGQTEEFDPRGLKLLQERIPDFEYVTIKDKKVKWLQFIGDEVLFDGDAPVPYRGFSIVPCFAYKDKSGRHVSHFGVVRQMIDPQKEVNKRWSQTLNLLMKQGQGGYFAELDAPVDQDQWESSITSPGETTWVSKGAISQVKFKEKGIPQFPDAAMRMQEFAADVMKKISGINPDLLGMDRGRQEPGVVIRLRQQQGMVLLAKLFKSYKRMKKQIAERRFAVIMAYMPDSQFKRILGDSDRYMFRGGLVVDKENGFIAPIRNLRDMPYNITAREAPGSMTKSMFELSIFLEMMSKGFPVDPETIISKLDLSASEKAKWKDYIKRQQDTQAQMAQQEQAAKLMEAQAKTQQGQAKLALDAKKQDDDKKLKLLELQEKEKEVLRQYALDVASLDIEERKLLFDLVAKLKQEHKEFLPPARYAGNFVTPT